MRLSGHHFWNWWVPERKNTIRVNHELVKPTDNHVRCHKACLQAYTLRLIIFKSVVWSISSRCFIAQFCLQARWFAPEEHTSWPQWWTHRSHTARDLDKRGKHGWSCKTYSGELLQGVDNLITTAITDVECFYTTEIRFESGRLQPDSLNHSTYHFDADRCG